jgi:hypothetical protein
MERAPPREVGALSTKSVVPLCRRRKKKKKKK